MKALKEPVQLPIVDCTKNTTFANGKEVQGWVDSKPVNAIAIPDSYPIPDIKNTLASSTECKYFITLDLTSKLH